MSTRVAEKRAKVVAIVNGFVKFKSADGDVFHLSRGFEAIGPWEVGDRATLFYRSGSNFGLWFAEKDDE